MVDERFIKAESPITFKSYSDLGKWLYIQVFEIGGIHIFYHLFEEFYKNGGSIGVRGHTMSWSDILVRYF